VNGKYQSLIRSTAAVRTYDEVEAEGWGVNKKTTHRQHVCYKDGVLGVIVRKFVREETVNRLTAYKSMYTARR